jgi:tail tube GTA-gp10-like protein
MTQKIIIDGKAYPLRLSMAALGELEEYFSVANIVAVAARLAKPSALDVVQVLLILLRAGGAVLDRETLAKSDLSPITALKAIIALFAELTESAGEGPGKSQQATPPKTVPPPTSSNGDISP